MLSERDNGCCSYGPKITVLPGDFISCQSAHAISSRKKCVLGKKRHWENTGFLKISRPAPPVSPRTKNQWPLPSAKKTQVPMALELPEDPNAAEAEDVAAVEAEADAEAARVEAPNCQVKTINLLWATHKAIAQ